MKFKLPILALGILISISQISQISQAATPPNLNDRIDCKRYIDETFSETVEMLSREDLPPAPNYDLLSKAVEKYYGDSNKIILDDLGYPSIMVRFDSFKDMRKKVHPMFKVDEKFYPCVYIGKYESIVFHDRAYSIPNVDPTTQVDIDDAREFSINKGIGWHLMTNVEYAGLARYCREHDFYPHGNTNTNQSEEFYPGESGRITIEERSDDGKILTRRMATGSGPKTWAHNGEESGIYDLNGNIWEIADGVRLVNGEIQVIADNNVVLPEHWNDWKAVNKRGKLVNPGSKNTWKLDCNISADQAVFHEIPDAYPFLSLTREHMMYPEDVDDDFGFAGCEFKNIKSTHKTPLILELHLIASPKNLENFPDDGFWVRNYGTRRLMRGGMWARSAGMFGGTFAGAWNDKSQGMGFRISYIELE